MVRWALGTGQGRSPRRAQQAQVCRAARPEINPGVSGEQSPRATAFLQRNAPRVDLGAAILSGSPPFHMLRRGSRAILGAFCATAVAAHRVGPLTGPALNRAPMLGRLPHRLPVLSMCADAAGPPPAAEEGPDPFEMLDVRVGQIVDAWEHPDSEKLWCERIDVGEEEPREIASGLRAYYSTAEELKGRKVLVVCNLKPLSSAASHRTAWSSARPAPIVQRWRLSSLQMLQR